jgi:hypothetical protein
MRAHRVQKVIRRIWRVFSAHARARNLSTAASAHSKALGLVLEQKGPRNRAPFDWANCGGTTS